MPDQPPAGDDDFAAIAATINPSAPAWDAIAHDVVCPLCGYNLRGLSAPRCPECGYAFAWPDVLDPRKQRHPYLFEHHPERNLWSFARTLIGTLNPLTFWRRVNPAMPSRPRRLMVYWLLTGALSTLFVAGVWWRSAATLYAYQWVVFRQAPGRLGYTTFTPVPNPAPRPFVWAEWWQAALDALQHDEFLQPTIVLAVFWLFWPWLTLLVMTIFRASLRRAQVRRVHVVRCLVYTFDVGAWAALASLAAAAAWVGLSSAERLMSPPSPFAPLACWLGAIALVTVRLWLAYRVYLRFRHAFWTVVASQVIVILIPLAGLALLDEIQRALR